MNYLVLGAHGGVGQAVCRRLAREGKSLILASRNIGALERLKSELPIAGDQSHNVLSLDLAAGDINLKKLRVPLDGMINCAGISSVGLLAAQSPSTIDHIIRVNLTGPILTAKAVVRNMLAHKKSGHIIFLSSVLAQRGASGSTVYSATKAGIEGFTKGLAREVGSRGICVNAIAPGVVDTDMGRAANPKLLENSIFPGFVKPDSVSHVVSFLLRSPSITGQTIVIDNGLCA